MKLRGKAWKFDGVLDVDWEICPLGVAKQLMARYDSGELTKEQVKKEFGFHCMTKVDPDFPKKVQLGDFLIGGRGMGYGHDHDHACVSIQGSGISAVICEAASGYFKRNSIHHGLPLIELKGIMAAVEQGDELELDLVAGTLENMRSGKTVKFQPWPVFLIDMVQAGGLYPRIGMDHVL
jgi:3-isopropylmalate/(R)-2-methylmalate dehydratase small subunit